VRFNVVIICEVERFAHRVNVSIREKRANVSLKARKIDHALLYVRTTIFPLALFSSMQR